MEEYSIDLLETMKSLILFLSFNSFNSKDIKLEIDKSN